MAAPARTLESRVAVVTGGGKGIGKGIALELGKRGAKVVVNYSRSSSAATAVVDELKTLGAEAIAVQADVTSQSDIETLFTKAIERFGRVDVVASNSGIEHFGPAVDVKAEDFDRVFAVNTRGQMFVATAAYRYMMKTGSNSGRIILTSSISARMMGVRDHALYAGSKAAVEGITRSLATDFGPDGVTVNAIAPGGVKTDMFTEVAYKYIPGADSSWSAERIENTLAAAVPLGRCCVPQDIGRVVAWLASEDSGWITGQTILCSGGSAQ